MSKKIEKIYSRPRIKLPEFNKRNYRIVNVNGFKKENKKRLKRKKFLNFLIVIFVAILTFKIIIDSVFPIFDRKCEEKAKTISTMISNEQVSEVMKKYNYDDLFSVEKDSSGNITMIKSNVININKITSEVSIKVQNELNKSKEENIEIVLGGFFGIKLISGEGPKIPIKISSSGNVKSDLKSEFSSQGINQTLHRVYLNVVCEVSALTPYNNLSETVTNKILLIENVIVGGIPDYYYNIDNNKRNVVENNTIY